MRFLLFFWTLQGFAAFNLTWGIPAISLDSNPPIGDTDSNATLAIDPMGNAIASWSRTKDREAIENIWTAFYNHSSRIWAGAVKISGNGSASNSQVAIDSQGNAIIVWEEGFPTQIMFRCLSVTGIITPDLSMPPEIVQTSQSAQTYPQISIDSKGNALAIWMEYSKGKNRIFSAKKPFGSAWVPLGPISSSDRNATLIPSKALLLNESGDGIAVWEEKDSHSSEIHAARFLIDAWTPSILISDKDKIAQSPSAGIDASGDAVIVWSQENIILSKTLMNGTLSSTSLAASDRTYVSQRPHVGLDSSGNAVVVFERYNAMHKFIAGATLTKNGQAWSKQIDISGPSPSDCIASGYPVFAMNCIGDGVVIWKEWTGTNMIIQGAGYSLGTWSSIKTLSLLNANSGAPTPAYDISVALNHVGNIFAIWPEDPNGTKSQQIKTTTGVGLANTGPLPPVADPITVLSGIVTGSQSLHRFPAHADLINVLSWTSPGGVDYFKVYRGSLSFLIGSTREQRFEDHQRIPKKKETYLITSVDPNGQESCPMTIVVNPMQ